MISLMTTTLVIVTSILGSFGSLFLKLGSGKITKSWKTFLNWRLISGIGLYGLSVVTYVVALKGQDLTIIYPLSSISYVFTLGLSIRFLNEELNLEKIGGVCLIMLGILIITR